VQIGPLTFDPGRRQLLCGQQEVRLSPKAWRLLEILVEESPKALSKAELQKRIWPDTFVIEANLPNLVSELRQALGDDARKPLFLRTVHGFGYALTATPSPPSKPQEAEPDVLFRLVWGSTEVDLAEGENVFGRDRQASIRLADESISRRHARVVVDGVRAVLEDLGSKNGTFHRGERIAAAVPLEDGDEITIGSVPMTVRVISTKASTVTKEKGLRPTG
jgi:DNA-binding winged helix-turn-helix (wHTH) protein